MFANRCLAQGTNAWTDVDHTSYTLTTAGSEGFLNMLPIYLDHVLYPTLTVRIAHFMFHWFQSREFQINIKTETTSRLVSLMDTINSIDLVIVNQCCTWVAHHCMDLP